MKDIEISQACQMLDIREVAKKIDISDKDLILYGTTKAKIKDIKREPKAKLILVTAISPTIYGEGKTTVSIGLDDALCKLNKKSVVVLREPSMGPVFGMKGGATGGGYSQVVPMEDINLHFTGDFHAITAANNLLCAAIDNHIYQGNELDIQEVIFNRTLDVNDRELRHIGLSKRNDSFTITAASEIMALFCLAESLTDLKERLGKIIIGYNSKKEIIYAKDLKVEGAMVALLKEAFLPNLVQTLEQNPAIIHGGPFANIAHGCNSVVATKLGLQVADYVVTEAGFGADLGAEKFYDIKCRSAKLKVDCTVLVATIKALKYHGGVSKENIYDENKEALQKGLANLEKHYNNLKYYGKNIVVCLNKYDSDLAEEIELVKDFCTEKGIIMAISEAYLKGGTGAIDVANKVLQVIDDDNDFKLLYNDDVTIKEKIETVCRKIYGASFVEYSDTAEEKLRLLEDGRLSHLPVCIAKTQYSLSDDAKMVGVPVNFKVFVRDIEIYNGAGFITVLLGNIMRMPGLPKKPNYEKIDVVDDKIIGLD